MFIDFFELGFFDNIEFAFLLVFELLFIGFGVGGIVINSLVFFEDPLVIKLNHFLFG